MYFIECNHCNHHNPVKTEFQTFCESCGKKMGNSFQEWKKVHPGNSFSDFKNTVAIQKDVPIKQYTNQKPVKGKISRDHLVLIISIVVFAALGGVFGKRIAGTALTYLKSYYANSNVFKSSDPASWQALVPEEGGFSISFPGRPLKNSQEAESQLGQILVTVYSYEPEIGTDDNLSYIIAHSDYPAYTIDSRYMTGIEIDQALDNSVNGSARNVQGTLVSSKKVKLGNFPGKAFEVSVQNGAAMLIGRSYLVNNTVYSLVVAEPANNRNNTSTSAFFDSFVLTEKLP